MIRTVLLAAALTLTTTACTKPGPEVDVKAIEAAAHGGYVAAINSNDTETLIAGLTDDIVYQAPGAGEVIGKQAVRSWIQGYFDAY